MLLKGSKILIIVLFLISILPAEAKETITYGTASWYSYESCRKEGTNGRYTASGRRFNDNEFIAASWDYPFGTILKVINLKTGASVKVTVWDRGPAKRLVKKGRIIDLSKAAFRKIADLEKGIIKVKVEEL